MSCGKDKNNRKRNRDWPFFEKSVLLCLEKIEISIWPSSRFFNDIIFSSAISFVVTVVSILFASVIFTVLTCRICLIFQNCSTFAGNEMKVFASGMQWLWLSWQSCCINKMRSEVRIQSWAKFFTQHIFSVHCWNDEIKKKSAVNETL